ncbi:MAG: AAA family ATPase [Candidatus Aminicenantes bacterium]|nr:AAA family ATPase [Candidatus Aminicenantes bacterium]NIM84241.1 AAA family ATPase [Candidatus Aminicenantes bacterium]NIN23690.1 AAA family ATPase [Candidatus Aminicenantes bacterium]NIN47397.1 AAA family ATPase [Candidatus Aminicenantes bacterium]NIN90325.1 AAA family ATPase [Candidatus Aminicenantes bacterium]
MDLAREVDILFRSRHTFICLISREEERVVKELSALCERSSRQLYLWDHADSFKAVVNCKEPANKPTDPLTALGAIEKFPDSSIIIFRDFHQCWKNQPRVIRKLRNLAQDFKFTRKTIVVTMPVEDIPSELKDETVSLYVPPPNLEELTQILDQLTQNPNAKVELTSEQREKFLKSALGLSTNQAQRVFARAIVSGGKLDKSDLQMVIRHKKEIIKESGALEFFTPKETAADVGGLDTLKKWLETRKLAFTESAKAYGLPAPKGVALLGIPGTGKSLTAKMIGSLWGIPLIRLDIGALFGSFVGQSEANVRQALSLAEAVAPCLLWVDEIEKGLAVGGGDGGTSARVYGNILSWMQEKEAPVFIVATANNIALMPPELLRRGRFDEIFFLDLPTRQERKAIFHVHIRKRSRDPGHFDLEILAANSEGYVGAEIEQAVIDAMFHAFSDPKSPEREFTTQDILLALKRLVPMSRSQKENIEMLRNWLKEGRARSASFQELHEAAQQFVSIALEPLEE